MKESILFKVRMEALNDFINLKICFPENEDDENFIDETLIKINVDRVKSFFKNENVKLACETKIKDFKMYSNLIKIKYLIKSKISRTSLRSKTVDDLSNYFLLFACERNMQIYSEYLGALVWKDLGDFLLDYTKKNN